MLGMSSRKAIWGSLRIGPSWACKPATPPFVRSLVSTKGYGKGKGGAGEQNLLIVLFVRWFYLFNWFKRIKLIQLIKPIEPTKLILKICEDLRPNLVVLFRGGVLTIHENIMGIDFFMKKV